MITVHACLHCVPELLLDVIGDVLPIVNAFIHAHPLLFSHLGNGNSNTLKRENGNDTLRSQLEDCEIRENSEITQYDTHLLYCKYPKSV